jgi:type II secretion system protein J
MTGKRSTPFHSFTRRIRDLVPKGPRDEGFSLIEILVASSIASIILIMVYSSYSTILRTIRDLSSYSEFHENLNLALLRMDRDIAGMFIDRDNNRAGLTGELDGDNSILNFVTINHRDFSISGGLRKSNPVSDINEVGYFLREDPQYRGVYFLVRREDRSYDDDLSHGGRESVILENVMELKFDFKLRNDWTSRWDSRQTKRFPQAIRTRIKIRSYTGREENFTFLSYPDLNG